MVNPHPTTRPRILITGTNGQVGFELTRSLALLGDVFALTRADVDLSDAAAIIAKLDDLQPDIIVNPAAYTAVDKAESDTKTAHAINTEAPAVMAKWAAAHNALIVHYSTDYVFEGTGDAPYAEDAPVAPQSVYGSTKLDGELAVKTAPRHIIIRTSWVFGAHGNNFLKTMLRLMQTRDTLNVVNDQIGAPTSAALIADVTTHIVADYLRSSDPTHYPNYGTYHLAAADYTSWHGYAQHIATLAEAAGIELKVKTAQIGGIPSYAYPTPAQRPANSRLDCNKIEQAFGIKIPHWHDGVAHAFTLISKS